jgi:hypothetical protein
MGWQQTQAPPPLAPAPVAPPPGGAGWGGLPPLPGVTGGPYGSGPPPTPAPAPKPKRAGKALARLGIIIAILVVGLVLLRVFFKPDNIQTSSSTEPTLDRGAAPWVAPDGSFGATFPAPPKQGPTPPVIPDTTSGEMWVSQSTAGVYGVEVEHLQGGKTIDQGGSFKNAIDGFSTGFGTGVTSTSRTAHQGHAAEDFTMAPKQTGWVTKGEVVITPSAFYIIFAENVQWNAKQVDDFINSVQLPA